MATVEKILGQKATAATTEWDLYTVGASTSTVVTCIMVCNRGTTSTTFRISTAPAGAATAPDQYQYYDYVIEGGISIPLSNIRWTLATTDKIRVYAGNANLSFTAYGSERAV
jgi:hypothetical protein